VPGSLIYSPRPNRFALQQAEAAPVMEKKSLVGEAIGVVDNGKLLNLGVMVEEELRRLGAKDVLRFRAPRYTELASEEFLDAIGAKVAGAITGLGN
jgi:hypothetical protein